MTNINPLVILGVVLFVVFSYFFPTVVAYLRRHRNRFAILILNLLLGWIAALVWACTADTKQAQITVRH
jgi:hypothetical protein